jgi:hypothetical protein
MLRDILREHADIPAAPDDVIQKAQGPRRVGTQQGVCHIEQEAGLHIAKHVIHILFGQMFAAESETLIRKTQRVAHAAVRGAGDREQAAVVHLHTGVPEHILHGTHDIRNGQAVKIEALAA